MWCWWCRPDGSTVLNGRIELAAISTETAPSVSFVHCRSVVICCTPQHFTIRLPFLNGEQLLSDPMHFSRQLWIKIELWTFNSLPVLLSKTTGSKSTALFCSLQLSPEQLGFRFLLSQGSEKLSIPIILRCV